MELYTNLAKTQIDFIDDIENKTLDENELTINLRISHLIGEQLIYMESKFLGVDATDLTLESPNWDNRNHKFFHVKLFGNKTFLTKNSILKKIILKFGGSYDYFDKDAFMSKETKQFFPYGQISISPNFSPEQLTLSIAYDGELNFFTYDKIFDINPYTCFYVSNQATEISNRLSGSIRFDYNDILNLQLNYTLENLTNYPIWIENNSLWNLAYIDITRQLISFMPVYNANKKFSLSGRLEYQTFSSLPDEIENIPYQSDISCGVDLSWFMQNNFSFNTKLNYVSERYSDAESQKKLDDYLVFDVYVSKEFRKNFLLFMKAYNILNKEYQIWNGYNEPKNRVLLGLGFKW